MKTIRLMTTVAAAYGCAVLLTACGSGGGGGGGSTTVNSRAVAGPISGATVIADKLLTGQKVGNGIADSGELTTRTNPDGTFSVTVPDSYGAYVFVTLADGIDTTTGAPNPVMYAPAGARVVTPLTSLVALASDPVAVQQKIATLGGSWDADISAAVPANLLALAKSTETVLKVLGGSGITAAQQQTVLAQIAAGVATAPTTAALTTGLSTTIQTAVQTAAATIPSVTNAATLASAVGTAVGTVVTAVNSLPVVNGGVSEQAIDQTAINQTINTATTTAQTAVSVFSASIASVVVGGQTITSGSANPTLSAASVNSIVVNLAALNATGVSGTLALKITVDDTTSARRATFTYNTVNYAAAGATSLNLTATNATLGVAGTTSTSAAVNATGVTASSLSGGTNTLTADLVSAQSALVAATGGVSSSLASISKPGTYRVSVAVVGTGINYEIIKTVTVN